MGIRIHLIRIQHYRLNTDTDLDPAFWWANIFLPSWIRIHWPDWIRILTAPTRNELHYLNFLSGDVKKLTFKFYGCIQNQHNSASSHLAFRGLPVRTVGISVKEGRAASAGPRRPLEGGRPDPGRIGEGWRWRRGGGEGGGRRGVSSQGTEQDLMSHWGRTDARAARATGHLKIQADKNHKHKNSFIR